VKIILILKMMPKINIRPKIIIGSYQATLTYLVQVFLSA
jgi:hypothetical protein